jgi:hypothetical protein
MQLSDRSSLVLRLRVYLTRASLDHRIAAGARWDGSSALALRAEQLSRLSTRRQIARQLRGTVDHVKRLGSRWVVSAVVLERAAVQDGRLPLLRLAERLEESAPVSPRGVALARELLTDGSGPLSNRESLRSVAEAVLAAEDALDEHASVLGSDRISF